MDTHSRCPDGPPTPCHNYCRAYPTARQTTSRLFSWDHWASSPSHPVVEHQPLPPSGGTPVSAPCKPCPFPEQWLTVSYASSSCRGSHRQSILPHGSCLAQHEQSTCAGTGCGGLRSGWEAIERGHYWVRNANVWCVHSRVSVASNLLPGGQNNSGRLLP